MIRVEPAPEPEVFDALVRQPGLNAIALRVGEEALLPRRGPRIVKVVDRREDLESKHFPPYWRDVTENLCEAYHRICAYACLRIARLTGTATVDHFAAISQSWDKVYEWSNYRLACSFMNGRKTDLGTVMDPFAVEDGFFALDLTVLKVVPGPNAGHHREKIEETIGRLGLDGADYKGALEDLWEDYFHGEITFQNLERHAPFLAREMRRQGRLRSGDV